MDRPFHFDFAVQVLPQVLRFLPVTLGMMAATAAAGSLAGFALARLRLRKRGPAAWVAGAFIMAMRCTPSIVLLFLVYYGLPALTQALTGIDINGASRVLFVVITLTLLFAASCAELFRAAYLAVPPGQREAALSAGLSEAQSFRRIVLPQAAVAALPAFGNALIALLKEGALAYTIGMVDMMGAGNLIITRNYGSYTLETYLALALIYWVLTALIERAFLALEARLSRGGHTIGKF
ncbi:MAG: amino acid ABC transporter permease [Spirochaetaceae bacterium]|jgi:L-cystine transport system permease protein|nr:amino acid ABC transporter permease [Spirochaetaceae bacterium]